MTREDIIRMAREIGVPFWPTDVHVTIDELQRFAALAAEWGAKQEREACAKVCEEDGLLWGQRYAAAIRKRGEVKP